MRNALKRAKITRLRAREKRKSKDYKSPLLQTIAMDMITYKFEGRNHFILTTIDLNTRMAYVKPLTKHIAKCF